MSRYSIALSLAAAILAACQAAPNPSSAGPSGSPPPGVTVVLVDGRFVPPGDTGDGVPTLSVPPRTTVTFRNEGALRHTATHSENGFPLPDALFDLDLEPGTELSYTFETPGAYQVTCVPHPEMVLNIVVE
jgi:heme/copper-type cytochrome/quinol oxidase subunit 2